MVADMPFRCFELARVKPNWASTAPRGSWGLALLTVSTFNRLGQYSRSPIVRSFGKPRLSSWRHKLLTQGWQNPHVPGNRAYCYTELAVFFPGMAEIPSPVVISAYQWRDSQAEWTWVAGLTKINFPWSRFELRPWSCILVPTGPGVQQLQK